MTTDPCLLPAAVELSGLPVLGHPVLDRYLVFVASRARPNTVLATASDLRAFFAVVAREPHEVVVGDVLGFIAEQTPVRAPRATAYAEHWVVTIRRECLDRLLIVNEHHLRRVIEQYVEHYNTHRPHRPLGQRPPDHAGIQASSSTSQFDRIQRRTVVGGLINEYERAA